MATLALTRLEAIKKRFCDLSIFVKEFKERFSRWFNKRRGNTGMLWMDRYKSVMVEDPKDYRWCGYAEAVSGSRRVQRGLSEVTTKPVDGREKAEGAKAYRCLLFSSGIEVTDTQNENVVHQDATAEEARQVLQSSGKLSANELVCLRGSYFCDGLVWAARSSC